MRTCSYFSVLDRAAALAGFTGSTITATPRAQMNTKITARLKSAWERAWWPEIMITEVRYYRETWLAQGYAAPSEVYHAGTSKYWTNLTLNAASTDVPGASPKWTELTDLDAYISLTQPNQTIIGEVFMVTVENPLVEDDPTRLEFILGRKGIQVLGETVPKSVYLTYRTRVPHFYGPDYDATVAYPLGRTLYYASASNTPGYEGDYWTTVSATAPGENPENTAAKWSLIEFPEWLRETVAHGAYADWLRLDGAGELAMAEDGVADGYLAEEVIKLAGQGQILFSRSA